MELTKTAVIPEPNERGVIQWEAHETAAIDPRDLDRAPANKARFSALSGALTDSKTINALEKDFVDWVFHETEIPVKANETLQVYAGPDVDETTFLKMCTEAADAEKEVELDKVEALYEKKIESIETKLEREERELQEDEADLARRKQEEMATHAETFLSLFSRRKKSVSSSMTKRRMTGQAQEDVEESIEAIAAFREDLDELARDMQAALQAVEDKWATISTDTATIIVTPYKKDINPEMFGVAWKPYYLVKEGDQYKEFPT